MFLYNRGFDIKEVLFVNEDYSSELNLKIVLSVYSFIILTKRFILYHLHVSLIILVMYC